MKGIWSGWVGRAVLLWGTFLLAGCAVVPLAATETVVGVAGEAVVLQKFWLDARMSVRVERPQEPVQQASGRLLWLHETVEDRVQLLSPFGQILAEMLREPQGVSLRLANGQRLTAPSLDELVRRNLGYPVPFEALPDWLAGKGSARSILQRDELDRPLWLQDGLWQVRYRYQDSQRLPASVLIESAEGIQLRLLPDQWLTGEDANAALMP